MADTTLDLSAMQQRVDDLGARIAALRQRVEPGTSREQELRAELAAMEQRHGALGAALARFDPEAARPEDQSVVHKLANDLDASIAKFTDWVDAEQLPAPPPGGFSP